MRISSKTHQFRAAFSASLAICARSRCLLAAATSPSDHSRCFRRSSRRALEPTAGSWRMIVLTGPNQIAVAAPAAVSSPAYVAELDAIKSSQATLTSAQRQSIAYWSGGGVMRWNQILRELVARYNLPPAPRDEGGYPVPDAENPFGDPAFPFANPVYAARAYSYVSAAQYDALKSAWYWKFQYNRLSPAKIDNAITACHPDFGPAGVSV